MNIQFTPEPKNNHNLPELLSGFYEKDQDWIKILDDSDILERIVIFAKENKEKFDHIVNIGIGGSALGAQAVRDSLIPYGKVEFPSLHIVDNVDPVCVQDLDARIKLEKSLFLVITKSGGTSETLSLFSYYKDRLEKAGHDPKKHIIFITDPINSYLRDIGNAEGYQMFSIPPRVGGRFSVLTSVGLVPAALAGIDVVKMMKGTQDMAKKFESEDKNVNTCYQMAEMVYENYKSSRNMLVTMPYAERLKTFGEWVAQLVAESTGKIDKEGKNVGISPVSALGVTDQHSQMQLFAQGEDSRTFIFISERENALDYNIPGLGEDEKVKYLQGKSFKDLFHAEKRGTIKTLQELHRPTIEIEISKINEESLGALFVLYEGMTAFLGEMMDINAFDQPGVERSKVLTKEFLQNPSQNNK